MKCKVFLKIEIEFVKSNTKKRGMGMGIEGFLSSYEVGEIRRILMIFVLFCFEMSHFHGVGMGQCLFRKSLLSISYFSISVAYKNQGEENLDF